MGLFDKILWHVFAVCFGVVLAILSSIVLALLIGLFARIFMIS